MYVCVCVGVFLSLLPLLLPLQARLRPHASAQARRRLGGEFDQHALQPRSHRWGGSVLGGVVGEQYGVKESGCVSENVSASVQFGQARSNNRVV